MIPGTVKIASEASSGRKCWFRGHKNSSLQQENYNYGIDPNYYFLAV